MASISQTYSSRSISGNRHLFLFGPNEDTEMESNQSQIKQNKFKEEKYKR